MKTATIWVLDQDTPAGMMTLTVKLSDNETTMMGLYPIGDFYLVRWALEAIGVEAVELEDTTYIWSEAQRQAYADAFRTSPCEAF